MKNKTQTRIYKVEDIETGTERLVEAYSRHQAMAHCSRGRYEVSIPRPRELAALAAGGITIEVAFFEGFEESDDTPETVQTETI